MNNAQPRESTIKSIQNAGAHIFGLAVDELSIENGPQLVEMQGHIAMYLSKQLTGASVSEIARHLGGRQQAPVIFHSIARVQELRATMPKVNKVIETLRKKLPS
jgi:chromosomal replication initiator protein